LRKGGVGIEYHDRQRHRHDDGGKLSHVSHPDFLDLLFEQDVSESRYPPIGSRPEGMLFRIMLRVCGEP
jgi:hypothetical protein